MAKNVFLLFLVKFQLRQIVTEFGVPGVLIKVIKSCRFQLNRDALWEYRVFQKILCIFHHPIYIQPYPSEQAQFWIF
jgi:hypothetical protein